MREIHRESEAHREHKPPYLLRYSDRNPTHVSQAVLAYYRQDPNIHIWTADHAKHFRQLELPNGESWGNNINEHHIAYTRCGDYDLAFTPAVMPAGYIGLPIGLHPYVGEPAMVQCYHGDGLELHTIHGEICRIGEYIDLYSDGSRVTRHSLDFIPYADQHEFGPGVSGSPLIRTSTDQQELLGILYFGSANHGARFAQMPIYEEFLRYNTQKRMAA